ncbi:MAG: DUF1361 domain-containing protein [bacterium]|nr:DUF1361 domain-containing protein [bacterium]
MEILLDNTAWMGYNIFLSVLGVTFGYLFLYSKTSVYKTLFFILWLLFLPNTIYLVTDLQHFYEQFLTLELFSQLILVVQYVIVFTLGVITYLLGFYPLERALSKSRFKKIVSKNFILVLANYLMAFGVALGRIERNNSWDIFTDPLKVVSSSLNLLFSPSALIYILLFGTFSTLLYFSCRDIFKRKVHLLR